MAKYKLKHRTHNLDAREVTYGEIVHIKKGECTVSRMSTVRALKSQGYELVPEKPKAKLKEAKKKSPAKK